MATFVAARQDAERMAVGFTRRFRRTSLSNLSQTPYRYHFKFKKHRRKAS